MLNRNELIEELEKIKGVRVFETHIYLQGANGELEWYFEKNGLVITLFSYEDFTNDPEQHFTNFSYQTILEIFQRFE